MDRIIAYCGLVCTECRAFAATQADDQDALERVAAEWRQEYNAPSITVDSVRCDGCLTVEGRKCAHCFECDVRSCGLAHDVPNCAYCDEYPCATLSGFFSFVPEARATLDLVRAGLAA